MERKRQDDVAHWEHARWQQQAPAPLRRGLDEIDRDMRVRGIPERYVAPLPAMRFHDRATHPSDTLPLRRNDWNNARFGARSVEYRGYPADTAEEGIMRPHGYENQSYWAHREHDWQADQVASAPRQEEEQEPRDTPKPKTRGRTATFLTDADRDNIIERIRRGEKQADLAKEFHVSRAAITNLKQRRQMLEMIEIQNNMKKRGILVDPDDMPDARRAKSDGGSSTTPDDVGAAHLQVQHRMSSQLVSRMLDPRTSDESFRIAVERQWRLLLEEAIASSCDQRTSYEPQVLVSGSSEAALLAEELRRMEPGIRTSPVTSIRRQTNDQALKLSIEMPTTVPHGRPVLLLLDDQLGALADPRSDAAADLEATRRTYEQHCILFLQAMLFTGVQEKDVYVIVNFCVSDFASLLAQRFPSLHLVTTRVLTDQDATEELALLPRFYSRLQQLLRELEARSREDAPAASSPSGESHRDEPSE